MYQGEEVLPGYNCETQILFEIGQTQKPTHPNSGSFRISESRFKLCYKTATVITLLQYDSGPVLWGRKDNVI